MASLVSPGVSVTITNESFFIPASATTVPLFFIATADEKKQPDGITPAAGTFESNVIRTVTSLTQSTQLYGIPKFLKDSNGNPQHGDVRNEYGLFALNQYLGIGTRAFAIRANVNLNDNFADLQALWDASMQESAYVLENLANSYISSYNTQNGYLPIDQADITALSLAPATSGTATVAFAASPTVTPSTPLGAGIVGGQFYGFRLAVDAPSYPAADYIVQATGSDTMTSMAALMTAALVTALVPATVTAVNNTFVFTSNSTGVTSTVVASTRVSPGLDLVTSIDASLGAISTYLTPVNGTNAIGSPGSGYTNGVYTNVPLTDITGIGTGATADITVAGTIVTAVTINQGGIGYAVSNSLTASPLLIGTGINTFGAIVPGSGYTNGTYLNVPLTGGTGHSATADITVALGAVTSVVINARGVGYAVSDVLSATPLTGVFSTTGNGVGFTIPVATVEVSSGFTTVVASVTPNLYKVTLTSAELLSIATTATAATFAMFSFSNSQADFFADHTSSPLLVYSNGFNAPPVGTGFLGFAGMEAAWVTAASGSIPPGTGWTPTEAGTFLLNAADLFKFTQDFLNQTSLGANDAARRSAVVTALAAIINSNTDIRSETYEYNLILCPGFPELVQEMVNLCIDIQEEAIVIADTPFELNPDDTVAWSATVARQSSTDVAYYYPHGLATNLDGATVFVAASGTALRTIAFSDSVADVWFAPAGLRRGVVTSLSDVGYVSGTLGTATTFVSTALNQGQRDNLYKYFTNINPIVFFPGQGIIVWGQKTSPAAASALDRINVVRLMMYIKRSLRKNTMSFVFEPNDKLTQDNLKALVDAFLNNLITKRGLYDFATVCDSSNNTPDRIDANELWIDIALKPVRAAEFIYIPIRIVATSAPLTTNG